MYYDYTDSPYGKIYLFGDFMGITHLHIENEEVICPVNIEDYEYNDFVFIEARYQLEEYFAGTRKTFNLVLNPAGTDFQKRVWNELTTIEYGRTKSYSTIAYKIGNENSSRAVGTANGKNPIPIIIPCHRVISKRGLIANYLYGKEMKKKLLIGEGNYRFIEYIQESLF